METRPEERPDVPDHPREDTQNRLIEAAIDLFGRHGFDGVTTRQLSETADTNIASITYHFGGKEGLYRAAIEQVVGEIRDRVGPLVLGFRHGLTAANGDRSVIARLTREFFGSLIRFILSDPRTQKRAALVIREILVPSRAFAVFYETLPALMIDTLAHLVATLTGRPDDAPETMIRAFSTFGQIQIFIVGRAVLLRRLGWEEFDAARIGMIADEVVHGILASLGLPDPEALS